MRIFIVFLIFISSDDTVVQNLTDQMGEMAMSEELDGAWEF